MGMGALEAFLPIYAVTVVGLSEFQAGLLWGMQDICYHAQQAPVGENVGLLAADAV